MPILVADDASPDRQTEVYLERLAASGALLHRLIYRRQGENVGFVRNVNDAFELLDPADVVVLNSDCIVGAEWLERLREAAHSDSTIATASALTNSGTILSVPERNRPRPMLPDGGDAERLAREVAETSLRLRPRIPTAVGHCMYIRRAALDLVGGFDEIFSPGYGDEVDFSQRCLAHGLVHVAADDVFVFHAGGASFEGNGARNAIQERNERVVSSRHPLYHDAVRVTSERQTGTLARALAAAGTALRPLSVSIDARFLGDTITGTQVQALELVTALHRTQRTDLRIVVTRHLGAWAREVLESLDGVRIVRDDTFRREREPRTDVVHRPGQLFRWSDLRLIPELGHRFVLTQLDLIAYRNGTYHACFTDWREYQRLTRLALSLADRVVFMSEHAAADAYAEDLVDERRAQVVPLGVDHLLPTRARPRRPRALPAAAAAGYLLCLGTNFRHKNRVFALRLLDSLQRRHGWDGWLVFAGPHAGKGTSAGDEAAFLSMQPRVAARTVDLRAVSEEEKLWLLERAGAVVYPSTYEGFGLVPFEAAAAGTPSLFAWQSSLRDVLPEAAATLVPWHADTSADAAISVLRDPERAAELVQTVREAGKTLRWDRTAETLADVYASVVPEPNRDVALLADEQVPLTLSALTSVQNPEVLQMPSDLYRATYALLTHPLTHRPFVRGVRSLYSLGYLARHGRRPRR